MTEVLHDPHGPSSHEMLLKCLGFQSGPPSEKAEEGTRLHEIAAEMLLDYLNTSYEPRKYSDEDILAVEPYVYRCIGLIEEYPDAEKYVEYSIPLENIGNDIGTLDFLIVQPFEWAIIVDYKSGMMMKHPGCPQMKSYASGVARTFNVERVMTIIVQPNAQADPDNAVFSKEELNTWEDFIKPIIQAAKHENVPLNPGDQCTFCKKNGKCIAQQAQVALNWPLIPGDVDPETIGPKEIQPWLDQIFDLDGLITAYQKLAGKFKQRAHALLEEGIEIEGYTLVPGRTSRVWKNETQARIKLAKLFTEKGLSEDDIEERKLLSPAKAEKALGSSKAVKAALPKIYKKPGSPKLERVQKKISG